MMSSNLKDLAFLYPDANGSGSFKGSLSGQIAKPLLNGEFTLENHAYRQWTIQHAAGGVRLDLQAETAELKNVQIAQGESQLHISGTLRCRDRP
jgi:autotransporter translocation and assembly factor TamB